jgi:hypothetical protein
MHPTDRAPFIVTVKLFPRLAMAHTSNRAMRTARTQYERKKLTHRVDGPEDLRGQLRARLLRMILDNEQVRRNEQRPSAS